MAIHIILYKLFTEWWQGQLCQSEVHLSEWDANDRDAENEAVENMSETYPNAAHKEPQHIHEYAQTAWLRRLPLHLRAERPDG